LAFRIERDGTL